MRLIVKALIVLFWLGKLSFSGTQFDLKVGNRKAIIYAPDQKDHPALVISMHGIGIPASWNQGMMKFEPLADTGNFVVAYPEGEDLRWDLSSDKDLNFILAIIDSLYNRYQIDRNRVYASGFSMGAMMSWFLACKIPDKIAAVVPGDGYPLSKFSGCSEKRHVPILQIYGTADSYYGKFFNDFLPSQLELYGCSTTPVKTKPYPVDVNGRNAAQLAQTSKSFKDDYGPCEKNGLKSELAIITVQGMVHDWPTPDKANANDDPNYAGKPFDVNGTWEAWNWMKTHSLPGDIPTVPASRDSVFNGDFEQGSLGWTFNVWGGEAEGAVNSGEYKIEISTAAEQNSAIQLIQNGIILEQGKFYQVKFDAYASGNGSLEANVEQDVSPWTSYLSSPSSFPLSTSKTTYSYIFGMTNATDSNSRLAFNVGTSATSLFLDNISIKETDAPSSLRDQKEHYELATLNWSGSLLEVTLQSTQRRLLSIGVYDVVGKPVDLSSLPLNGRGQVSWQSDFQGRPHGIYFVKIKSGERIIFSSKLLFSR